MLGVIEGDRHILLWGEGDRHILLRGLHKMSQSPKWASPRP